MHGQDWWWDRTWNPVFCARSEGCRNCYVPPWLKGHTFSGGAHAGVITYDKEGRPVFSGILGALRPGHRDWSMPLNWRGAEHPKLGAGQPSLIFVGDMADLFHQRRPEAVIDRVVVRIAMSDHIGLLVTKRTARMAAYFSKQTPAELARWRKNIWLGFSAERQKEFDLRWPHMRALADTGFKVFVSVAPLIAPVTLPPDFLALGERTWVIVAGEQVTSEQGPPRDMHPDWARALLRQCRAHSIPFFFKQMAKKAPIPPDLLFREFPRLWKEADE